MCLYKDFIQFHNTLIIYGYYCFQNIMNLYCLKKQKQQQKTNLINQVSFVLASIACNNLYCFTYIISGPIVKHRLIFVGVNYM